jgi:hypothetical protein
MLGVLQRRRDTRLLHELLEAVAQLAQVQVDTVLAPSGSTWAPETLYTISVPWTDAVAVRELVAASGLPLDENRRTRAELEIRGRRPTGVHRALLSTDMPAREAALLFAAATEQVAADLASGAHLDESGALPPMTLAQALLAPEQAPWPSIRVSSVIRDRHYAAVTGGMLGDATDPTAVHETFASLLLDASGLQHAAASGLDHLWQMTNQLLDAFTATPELFEVARKLGAPSPHVETQRAVSMPAVRATQSPAKAPGQAPTQRPIRDL